MSGTSDGNDTKQPDGDNDYRPPSLAGAATGPWIPDRFHGGEGSHGWDLDPGCDKHLGMPDRRIDP